MKKKLMYGLFAMGLTVAAALAYQQLGATDTCCSPSGTCTTTADDGNCCGGMIPPDCCK